MKHILYNKWIELCDFVYDEPEFKMPEKSGVIFVPMDHIAHFFQEVEKTNLEFVVVSAASDYGLVLQKNHPVWFDMQKWLRFISLDKSLGYRQIGVPPRANTELCKIDDTFSVKMNSFTNCTFNKIPENIVRWFSTNNEIEDQRIINIPFGILEDAKKEIEKRENVHNRHDKIYVNFSVNSIERVIYNDKYSSLPYINHVYLEKTRGEYIDDLFTHKYVLCLPGNGIDCYRNLETLYSGAIPITIKSKTTNIYRPSLVLNSIDEIPKLNFQEIFEKFDSVKPVTLDNTFADMLYWESKIEYWRNQY